MTDSEQQQARGPEDEDPEETPGYQPPAQKTLEEIQKLDADDESLKKYKEQLLGQAAAGKVLGKFSESCNCFLVFLRIYFALLLQTKEARMS